ncbi:hypothetical protein [Rhodococcus sp. NPDC127528]|uniref:hypothetical protein n=1 Tax=unclassified Rhodococcus (in: high G+C Gram-positive bacteria) TaxID=192944 RepID=UPI0036406C9B
MSGQFGLDGSAVQAVAEGLAESAYALESAAEALRGRGLDRLADSVCAWSRATFADAERLRAAVAAYRGRDGEFAGTLDGTNR